MATLYPYLPKEKIAITTIALPVSNHFILEDNILFKKLSMAAEPLCEIAEADSQKDESTTEVLKLAKAFVSTHISALIESSKSSPLSHCTLMALIKSNPDNIVPEVKNTLLSESLKELLIEAITIRSPADAPTDIIEMFANECLEALIKRDGKPISPTAVKILAKAGKGVIVPEVMNAVLCESTEAILVERVVELVGKRMERME